MRTFRCGLPFILASLCVFLMPAGALKAQDTHPNEALFGAWSAEEDYFRPVFRFKRGDDRSVIALLANDKSQEGNPFSSTTVRGDSIFLELASANAHFQGALSEAGSRVEGTWIQGERSASLTLTPIDETNAAEKASEPRRPQRPEPPYPYVVEEVTFRAGTGGATLTGTLTRPKGSGPYPGVVLLSGSGGNNRNYEIGDHAFFHVLADHLTRHGFTVLRYDKRGVAESEGRLMSASQEDFVRDAAAALRFLKSRPSVATSETGFVAHSMGAMVAPQASQRFERAAFLALLMPPSRPGHKVLAGQKARLAAARGAPEAAVDSVRRSARRFFDAIRTSADSAEAASRLRSIYAGRGFEGAQLEQRVAANTSPWFRDFMQYDPVPTLRAVDTPVLAVFGTKDLFVPPERNAAAMRSALEESGAGSTTVRVIEGLNHWMQPAESGLTTEISEIETTVAPELLSLLTDWMQKHTSVEE